MSEKKEVKNQRDSELESKKKEEIGNGFCSITTNVAWDRTMMNNGHNFDIPFKHATHTLSFSVGINIGSDCVHTDGRCGLLECTVVIVNAGGISFKQELHRLVSLDRQQTR